MKQTRRWHKYPDNDALKQDIVKNISNHAQQSILTHGCFRIVFAGGSTPKAVYQGLRNIKTEWSGWHIYFGDERCLPDPAAHRWTTHRHRILRCPTRRRVPWAATRRPRGDGGRSRRAGRARRRGSYPGMDTLPGIDGPQHCLARRAGVSGLAGR